jgi:hypothetical protein
VRGRATEKNKEKKEEEKQARMRDNRMKRRM